MQSLATLRVRAVSRRYGGTAFTSMNLSSANLSAGRQPVVPWSGHRQLDDPLLQFPVQVLEVEEPTPRQEVAFDVLHAGFDLTLGLRPVGLAEPRGETEVPGEIRKLGVEGKNARGVVDNNGLRVVVKQLQRPASKPGKSFLMRRKKGRQLLIEIGPGE